MIIKCCSKKGYKFRSFCDILYIDVFLCSSSGMDISSSAVYLDLVDKLHCRERVKSVLKILIKWLHFLT